MQCYNSVVGTHVNITVVHTGENRPPKNSMSLCISQLMRGRGDRREEEVGGGAVGGGEEGEGGGSRRRRGGRGGGGGGGGRRWRERGGEGRGRERE